MLRRVTWRLVAACALALSLVGSARAGVSVTRTLQVDPEHLPAVGPIEVPDGERILRAEVISLECAVDGVRAPAGTRVRMRHQGFLRGQGLAWLELPDGSGLPAGHEQHAARMQVRLELEHTGTIPVPRERVVPEWEESSGSRTATSQAQVNASATLTRPPAAEPTRSSSPRPRAEPFRPTQVPSLLGSPVAYLIITSEELVPSFQPLADWKTASGVPAAVRTLDFIREQYPAAVDDPDRIRMFIRDAYSRWGTRWVLLGGDTELIPPRIAYVQFLDDVFVPTDLYYSCLDGNWNADGDSLFAEAYAEFVTDGDDADLLPEVR